ncbi:uncharacterized protein LOC129314334 isoform X2 [Prosopis cineraria]|uniref:uncharacterized protein LOC129314334 isoform X2 n=1 Tax=Prosopis cineraria TaxID=364024 RepID=UPI00240ED62F|nr:uncharacterized protein LOC129314334 isoform X2 [Prosopis cineraria]
MDEEAPPPPLVSLPPILPSSGRRLSTAFLHPIPPLSSPANLAWVSLQGRLVNSEEASSVRTIRGGLTPQEALAWELFTPIQRFLIVAVVGVAVAESKKSYQIWQLKKSVELRDQVLSSMQEKLDSLCELVNHTKEHSIAAMKKSMPKNGELLLSELCGSEKAQFADCDYWPSDQQSDLFAVGCSSNFRGTCAEGSVTEDSGGNEMLHRTPLFIEEQEERRMSDLSWASSVTSASDFQLNSLALEQDLLNLKRDCREKDTKIQELSHLLNFSEVSRSKRVAELEDIVRRKNSTITKLKKELVVLEQKFDDLLQVVQLSRLRRPSSSCCDSHDDQVAHVRENLLYDMESSTGPSSSDSDSTPLNSSKKSIAKVDDAHVPNRSCTSAGNQKVKSAKSIGSSGRALEQHLECRSLSSHKVSGNRKLTAASSKPNRFSAHADLKSRRRS